MNFVTLLVEGQTEETFVRDVLNPSYPNIEFTPVLYETRRQVSGHKYGGGGIKFGGVKQQLLRLLNDNSATLVTTMLDYHRLDPDFPGYNPKPADPLAHVQQLEKALEADIDRYGRFKAYFSLHDFEALVFSDVEKITQNVPGGTSPIGSRLQAIRDSYNTPEHINGQNPPAYRLHTNLPSYRKTTHSPLIVGAIGLDEIRKACPHFDSWLRVFDALAMS